MTQKDYYTLSDFTLGRNDGKKEATYVSNFKELFLDFKNIKSQAIHPETYLILGRKGCGKTLLAEVIKDDATYNPIQFCEIASLKSFNFQTLLSDSISDQPSNDSIKFYNAIWEWVILVQLGQLILQDESLHHFPEYTELKNFYDANYSGNFELNTNKIVEETRSKGLNLSFEKIFKADVKLRGDKTLKPGNFLNYTQSLKEYIIILLSKTTNQYNLFYDELDDNFKNTNTYKETILSLVNSVNDLNVELFKNNCYAKIVILLRSDIFFMLNHPDLEKIRQSNAMQIHWGDYNDSRSPLFSMILKKVRKSVPELSKIVSDDILFRKIFSGNSLDKRILENTLLRPRDLITYLNLMIRASPRSTVFKFSDCAKIEKEYSTYLSREIRNTLSGVLTPEEIDGTYYILRKLGKSIFKYKEISSAVKQNMNSLPNEYNLAKCLRAFFKANSIGFCYYRKKKTIFMWNYRSTSDSQLDLNESMMVHRGLEKFLNIDV